MANNRGKKYKPGKSGNPRGRPKLPKELKVKARDCTEAAFAELKKLMKDDNSNVRMKAIELILAYGHGRPKQQIEADVRATTTGSVTIYIPDNGRDQLLVQEAKLLPEGGGEDDED